MHCTIPWCESTYNKRSKDISFHKFPKAEWKRKKWMECLNLDLDTYKPSQVICSNHFHEIDFIPDCDGNRRLFPSAMPILPEPFKGPQIIYLDMANFDEQQPNANAQETEKEPAVEELFVDTEQSTSQLVELQISPTSSIQSCQENEESFGISNRVKKKIPLKKAMCSLDDSSSNFPANKMKRDDEIETLRQFVISYKRKIKTLNGKVRRRDRKLESLKKIIENFKTNT